MGALDPEVVDAVWAVMEPHVEVREAMFHPLGCHLIHSSPLAPPTGGVSPVGVPPSADPASQRVGVEIA